MFDRTYAVLAVVSVALLAFLAGGLLTVARQFPYEPLRDAYIAAKAVLQQQRERGNAYQTDLWKDARTEQRGVTVHEAADMQPGYTLYSSGHTAAAYLIDASGKVVHHWQKPYSQVWDQTAAPLDPVPDDHTFFRKVLMYANGDLLAVYDGVGDKLYGYGLVKLDRDSRLIWKYLLNVHHDVDVAPDGRVFALTHEIGTDEFAPRKNLGPPRIDDFVVELSPTGLPVRKIRVLDALARSHDYLRLLDTLPGYLSENGDYLHTNDVDYIDETAAASSGIARPGQLLLSMREPGVIAVLDPDSETITWAMRGFWVGQHDPDLLPDGRLLLFDNNGNFGPGGRSQVVEFDPQTLGIAWRYAGDPQRPFESIIRSSQQRLSNGNTLITESDGGRLLEVTVDGRIVWEFVNPVRGGPDDKRIPVIASARRIDPALLDPEFRQTLKPAVNTEKGVPES